MQPVGAEGIERCAACRQKIVDTPVPAIGRRVEAREFREHVRARRGRSQVALHVSISSRSDRRLAEVVDHESSFGNRPARRGMSAEVTRKHDRQLKDDSAPRAGQGFEHLGPQDPVRVGLVVDEVAHARNAGAPQLVEPLAARSGSSSASHAVTARDPVMSRRLREQVVRVGVEAGALYEDDGVDAVPFEQRVEIARAEWRARSQRARTSSTAEVCAPHPRDERAHRRSFVDLRQPDSVASAASVHARPYGNSYRASDSGFISML